MGTAQNGDTVASRSVSRETRERHLLHAKGDHFRGKGGLEVDETKRALAGRRYDAYRPINGTGISEAPAHWEPIRLRRVATFRPSPDEIRGMAPDVMVTFLPMEAISDRGTFDRSSVRPLAEVSNGYSYFRDGDVIRAKVTPCFENGKGAVVDRLTGGYGFGTTELFIIRPGDRLDARFLYYLTMSDPFVALGTATIYGAHGVKRVRDDFVRDFAFGLPPLAEQRAIASSLGRATTRIDRILQGQRSTACLLVELRASHIDHSVFGRAFNTTLQFATGNEWIRQIPSRWRLMRVKRLVSGVTSGSRGWAEYFSDGGALFLRITNLRRDGIELLFDDKQFVSPPVGAEGMRTGIQQGDVLVSITADIGSVGYVRGNVEEAYVNQHLALLHPHPDCVGEWLAYALKSSAATAQFAAAQYGGTKVGLSLEDVKNVWLPVPPSEVQAAIAQTLSERLRVLDQLETKVREQIARLTEYRAALITAAVTGQIDVRAMTT